jgi:hypothetical protein
MKRVFLVSLFTLLIIAPLTLTAQTTTLKFSQDGEFASFSQSNPPFGNTSLSVSRNLTTGSTATASISFITSSFSSDFSTFTFTQIVGSIPAGDFTGQNTNNLNLNFNTADLDPSGVNQSCSIDIISFIVTCGPGPSGTISVSFTQNGVSRTRVLALGEEITVGNTTTRIHQRSDNASANYSGTIFGNAVSGSDGTVGINHNSSLEFIKN